MVGGPVLRDFASVRTSSCCPASTTSWTLSDPIHTEPRSPRAEIDDVHCSDNLKKSQQPLEKLRTYRRYYFGELFLFQDKRGKTSLESSSTASCPPSTISRILHVLLAVLLYTAAMATNVDDDEGHFEIRRRQYGRMPLGPEQVFFKPCIVYQTLLDAHVVETGLELRINMTSGLKEARFNKGVDAEGHREEIIAKQLRVLPDDHPNALLGDGAHVELKVSAAASWDDSRAVTHLLQTCYVTRSHATKVLYEVAARGGPISLIEILLQAGADPAQPLFDDDRTSLHAACAAGHEEQAATLIDAMHVSTLALRTKKAELTAVELLRANDFGPIARRLDAKIQAKATTK